jgi:methylated-DNA-protein-cysteine methyltransferase-like protein
MSEIRVRIYAVVAAIPRGRVVTYGQVAAMAGAPRHARQVGYALFDLPEGSPVPWHRVVNARGEISQRSESGCENIQRSKLEAEGIEFRNGRVDLELCRWEPNIKPGEIMKRDDPHRVD